MNFLRKLFRRKVIEHTYVVETSEEKAAHTAWYHGGIGSLSEALLEKHIMEDRYPTDGPWNIYYMCITVDHQIKTTPEGGIAE